MGGVGGRLLEGVGLAFLSFCLSGANLLWGMAFSGASFIFYYVSLAGLGPGLGCSLCCSKESCFLGRWGSGDPYFFWAFCFSALWYSLVRGLVVLAAWGFSARGVGAFVFGTGIFFSWWSIWAYFGYLL